MELHLIFFCFETYPQEYSSENNLQQWALAGINVKRVQWSMLRTFCPGLGAKIMRSFEAKLTNCGIDICYFWNLKGMLIGTGNWRYYCGTMGDLVVQVLFKIQRWYQPSCVTQWFKGGSNWSSRVNLLISDALALCVKFFFIEHQVGLVNFSRKAQNLG